MHIPLPVTISIAVLAGLNPRIYGGEGDTRDGNRYRHYQQRLQCHHTPVSSIDRWAGPVNDRPHQVLWAHMRLKHGLDWLRRGILPLVDWQVANWHEPLWSPWHLAWLRLERARTHAPCPSHKANTIRHTTRPKVRIVNSQIFSHHTNTANEAAAGLRYLCVYLTGFQEERPRKGRECCTSS